MQRSRTMGKETGAAMNVRHVLAFAASLALLPGISVAQGGSRQAGWDFGADLLYQFSHDVSFEGGSSLSTGDDLGLALSFGYRFTPRVELQFSLDWNSVDYDAVLQSALDPTLAVGVHGDMETFTPR